MFLAQEVMFLAQEVMFLAQQDMFLAQEVAQQVMFLAQEVAQQVMFLAHIQPCWVRGRVIDRRQWKFGCWPNLIQVPIYDLATRPTYLRLETIAGGSLYLLAPHYTLHYIIVISQAIEVTSDKVLQVCQVLYASVNRRVFSCSRLDHGLGYSFSSLKSYIYLCFTLVGFFLQQCHVRSFCRPTTHLPIPMICWLITGVASILDLL